MEAVFRNLKADEIDVRIYFSVKINGLSLLLYKDASRYGYQMKRLDLKLVEEKHSRDNANCVFMRFGIMKTAMDFRRYWVSIQKKKDQQVTV